MNALAFAFAGLGWKPRRGRRGSASIFFALGLLLFLPLRASEVIPPAPRDHFNDYAGVVDRGTGAHLEQELTQFERDTSNQILVAIFPKMQSDSSVEDYTVRVAQSWGVGQRDRKNGAVLFVFIQDHKVYIQVGYGLEGPLPDALAKRIIENEITPRFRQGDYTGGVAAGARAMMGAVRGEYSGSGRTVADSRGGISAGAFFPIIILAIIVFSFLRAIFGRRNVIYTRRGRRSVWVNNTPWWGGGGGGGGGSWSSGSSGGSFSGGGGSFGGGGAGGSW